MTIEWPRCGEVLEVGKKTYICGLPQHHDRDHYCWVVGGGTFGYPMIWSDKEEPKPTRKRKTKKEGQ